MLFQLSFEVVIIFLNPLFAGTFYNSFCGTFHDFFPESDNRARISILKSRTFFKFQLPMQNNLRKTFYDQLSTKITFCNLEFFRGAPQGNPGFFSILWGFGAHLGFFSVSSEHPDYLCCQCQMEWVLNLVFLETIETVVKANLIDIT